MMIARVAFLVIGACALSASAAEDATILTTDGDIVLTPVEGRDVKFVAADGKTVGLTATFASMQEKDAVQDAAAAAFSDATDAAIENITIALDELATTVEEDVAVSLEKLENVTKKNDAEIIAKLDKSIADAATANKELTKSMTDNIAKTKEDLSKSIDASMKKAADERKKLSDTVTAAMYCPKPPGGYGPLAVYKGDFDSKKYVVGMTIQSTCKDGQYNSAGLFLYCTSAKRWCTNPTYCPKSISSGSCTNCQSPCKTCYDKTKCKTCSSAGTFPSASYKINIVNGLPRLEGPAKTTCDYKRSCRQIHKIVPFKDGAHTTTVKTPNGKKTVRALCIQENKRTHTTVPCSTLTGGGCRGFWRFYEHNSCRDYGYQVTPFRSRRHNQLAWDKYGGGFMRSMMPGAHVFKTGSRGRYTGCIMRHGSNGGGSCGSWRAYDNKMWWLRDGRYGEPNGDYSGWCNLHMHGWSRNGYGFNDGWCYHSGGRYFCGTNDYDN